jgi:hypothetical protein
MTTSITRALADLSHTHARRAYPLLLARSSTATGDRAWLRRSAAAAAAGDAIARVSQHAQQNEQRVTCFCSDMPPMTGAMSISQ